MFYIGECTNLTVTPGGITCPGVDMAFICRRTPASGGTVTNVRWRLTDGHTDVRWRLTDGHTDVLSSPLALTQGRGCPQLNDYYNSHLIVATLYDSYSTLNITADGQLHGLIIECVLISDNMPVERETLQIQITRKIQLLEVVYYTYTMICGHSE